jgi:hypothetical protein
MDKTYVTLEQHCCPICCKTFDTGTILLDKRLNKVFDHRTVTDWEICKEHKDMLSEYAFLVGATSYAVTQSNRAKLDEVKRTGDFIAIRRSAWNRIFNVPVPETFGFIDPEGITKLKQMMAPVDAQLPES